MSSGGTSSGGTSSGGTSSGGTGTGGTGTGASAGADSGLPDGDAGDVAADQFFVSDPPPTSCTAGGIPVVPGGTPACPSDKNLEGCPCAAQGQTAACWPGYRKNRNHGNCQDGTTSCVQVGPNTLAWGPCVGFAGLDPNTFQPLGTTGKASCSCFSGGYWKIDNVSPCFFQNSGGQVIGATSTIMPVNCPTGIDFTNPVPPSAPWSTDSLQADCSGYFKLCYTLKGLAAPGAAHSTSDCVMK
jgi:hypothetical protein